MALKTKKYVPGRKAMLLGGLVFLVGLLRYYGIGWPEVLIIVGALIFLKGLLIKK